MTDWDAYVETLSKRWTGKTVRIVGGIAGDRGLWRFAGYPLTLVVEAGLVTLSVPGAYDGKHGAEVEKLLAFNLPGLLPPPRR